MKFKGNGLRSENIRFELCVRKLKLFRTHEAGFVLEILRNEQSNTQNEPVLITIQVITVGFDYHENCVKIQFFFTL